MKLIIDRSRWLRGNAENSSLLDPSSGHMCCLGFLAKACGASDEVIEEAPGPAEVPTDVKWPVGLVYQNPAVDEKLWWNTEVGKKLMNVNDDEGLNEMIREEKITNLFFSIGIEVEFE